VEARHGVEVTVRVCVLVRVMTASEGRRALGVASAG
jgi:hypothetical protein